MQLVSSPTRGDNLILRSVTNFQVTDNLPGSEHDIILLVSSDKATQPNRILFTLKRIFMNFRKFCLMSLGTVFLLIMMQNMLSNVVFFSVVSSVIPILSNGSRQK